MIEVENLSKFYSKFQVLNNLNFSIKKGEITGFLGPNGAGKTTTMRVLTGYSAYQTGKVMLNGFCATKEPQQVKASVGYLPENLYFYEEFTIYETLKWMADLKKINKTEQRINEVMELTEIVDEQNQLIQTLSRGYRQRLGIASALLSDPPILILDEPTNGLDPLQIIGIRKLIKDLGKNKTILISTHILSEVDAVCDKVILIDQGKVVIHESLDKIRNVYKNNIIPFTIRVEDVTMANKIIRGSNYIQSSFQEKEIFYISLKNMDSRKNLIQDMIPAGILEFKIQESPLENLFQNLRK